MERNDFEAAAAVCPCTPQDVQMAAIIKSRFRMMNTVHLDTGMCERLDLSKNSGKNGRPLAGDYAQYIQSALANHVHPDDAGRFWDCLSLDHLRERAATLEDYADEVCQYRLRGEPVRWIELHVRYSRQEDQVLVNILGQDITREKQQEESRLQALEDRAYIISSLSSLFFSTYYIDVEHDTFRAVTQLRRVGHLLGDEVNCAAALQLYASHFIYPEDRESYLAVMNVAYLKQTLRWWQPCVAVEYRRLPEFGEGEVTWIRASAVLARTGEDDLPKTVVYVAQELPGAHPSRGKA